MTSSTTTPRPVPASETIVTRTVAVLGAALVITTGAIHLYLYEDYFSTVPTIGRLFVANFLAGVALGGLMLLSRAWVWPLLGAAYCITTLGAFLWSVQWGLFGYQESFSGTWQTRAAVAEVIGTLLCITTAMLHRRPTSGRSVSPR